MILNLVLSLFMGGQEVKQYPYEFEGAVSIVLQNEGGFSNHKSDRGGATNFGITIQALSDWRGKPQSSEDVQKLDIDEAKEIYYQKYWKPLRLDDFYAYSALKTILFDQAVNRGVGTITRQIQRFCGSKEDGILGPRTFAAFMEKIGQVSEKKACLTIVKDCQLKYIDIAQNDSTQMVFLGGWIKRTHKYFDLI